MSNYEFKKGDTFEPTGDLPAIAGIHVPPHGNRIEIYGQSVKEAEKLRDVVLCSVTEPLPNEIRELVEQLIELVKDNEFYRGGKWFELADEIIAKLEAIYYEL